MDTSPEYKKALKAWEGEKRAAIKKAKSLKGKKAKETLAQIEMDFDVKLQALKSQFSSSTTEEETTTTTTTTDVVETTTATTAVDPEEEARQRKRDKAQRKKEKQRLKDAQKMAEEEDIAANAGPNMRHVELEQIQGHLRPLQLQVVPVAADGHCLYRAVGAQTQKEYMDVRSLCADTLAAHPDDFSPFCEYDDDTIKSFEDYVARVRNSAEWGGHLELRALAMALERPILVHQATSEEPLEILPTSSSNHTTTTNFIRLSYHRHYYALGEHYNQVVPISLQAAGTVDEDS